ncbi:MAG TPA: arginyltransferase [Campylobacter avium]|nr:arginyltransferase [Campylobacter avium]
MQILSLCSLEHDCPYLENKFLRNEYNIVFNCSKKLNQELISRGWRRFGKFFSRPICRDCNECVSYRIKVDDFKLSRQFKRVLKKNQNTKLLIDKPGVSNERLYIYNKYHKYMQEKRAWEENTMRFSQYYSLYVDGDENFGYELRFYVDNKLVCVDLIDILEDGISSIYCYYDPDFSYLNLGKFSLLKEIEIAKNRGLKYIYLGYFVKGCQSLSYKADYTPNEILKMTSSLYEVANLWESNDANSAKPRVYKC